MGSGFIIFLLDSRGELSFTVENVMPKGGSVNVGRINKKH
jgi:hypothetical protein